MDKIELNGVLLYSENNKMGIFIVALKEKEKIYNMASKAYEDWMSFDSRDEHERFYESWAIGDYVIEMLKDKGYKKEEDYYMFFDSDWD